MLLLHRFLKKHKGEQYLWGNTQGRSWQINACIRRDRRFYTSHSSA